MPYRRMGRLRDEFRRRGSWRPPAAPGPWMPEEAVEKTPVLLRFGMLAGLVALAWWMWKHWDCGKGGTGGSTQASVPAAQAPQLQQQRGPQPALPELPQQPAFVLRFMPEPRDPQVPLTSFARLELPDGTTREISGWSTGRPDLDEFYARLEQGMAAARAAFPGVAQVVVEDYRHSRETPIRVSTLFRNQIEQALARAGFQRPRDIHWVPTWVFEPRS